MYAQAASRHGRSGPPAGDAAADGLRPNAPGLRTEILDFQILRRRG